MKSWYVLQSKTNKEHLVIQQLKTCEIEFYYPTIQIQTPLLSEQRHKPFFPGYIFIRVNVEKIGINTIQYLPYSKGVVCYGDEPARISGNIIQALLSKLEEQSSQLFRKGDVKQGEKVCITGGPFKGHEAIFDVGRSGSSRARLLLELMNNKRMPVVLERDTFIIKNNDGIPRQAELNSTK